MAAEVDYGAAVSGDASLQLGPVLAQLSASVDTLSSQVRAMRAEQEALNRQPRYIGQGQTITLNGSGVGVLGLGGPNMGYQWTLKRLSICAQGANSVATSMGGALGYLFGGTIGSDANVNIGPQGQNYLWVFPVLPNAATFGSDDLVLQYGEEVTVYIAGGIASQQVAISWAYQLYQPGPAARRVVPE